jgi:DNA-binding LytR/AlgR family response regulator
LVDDEYLALTILQEYAARIPELSIEGCFTNPKDAANLLQEQAIDVLLLDIQMPYLNGFELLQSLAAPPMVVFTTARHDFAVKAFELDVLDYLVKPIPFERFKSAIDRAVEYKTYLVDQKKENDSKKQYLMIKADYQIVKIMVEEILYIEGLGEYVKIYTMDKMHVTLAALRTLLKQLPTTFIRIHKSYIVSTPQIASFNHRVIRLRNKKELPIGRVYRSEVIGRISFL